MSQDDLDKLATWRTIGARNSEEVVRLAPKMLTRGGLGDAEWATREQLAIAALDLGHVKLANAQLRALEQQFPASPRVDILHGLKHEAMGDFVKARTVYETLLREDGCNVTAYQRMIAMARTPTDAIQLLLGYLDTFYTDPQGWSYLAELYADQGAYSQSLTALGHLMVIQTWDSIAVLRAAETAYTMNDYQLALKYFLRAVEMEGEAKSVRTRSWWGVKQCTKRLLDSGIQSDTTVPASSRISSEKLRKLEALATQAILGAGGPALKECRAVLGSL